MCSVTRPDVTNHPFQVHYINGGCGCSHVRSRKGQTVMTKPDTYRQRAGAAEQIVRPSAPLVRLSRSGGTSPPASGEATAGHRSPGEDGRSGGRAGGAPGRMICDLYRGRTMRNPSKVRSYPGSSFLTTMAPAVLAVSV